MCGCVHVNSAYFFYDFIVDVDVCTIPTVPTFKSKFDPSPQPTAKQLSLRVAQGITRSRRISSGLHFIFTPLLR